MNQFNRLIFLLVVSLLAFTFVGIPGVQSYDFSRLGEPSNQTREPRNFTNDVQSLRTGSIPGLSQFEVDAIDGKLVWIVGADRTLHLSTGNNPKFTPGDYTRELSGTIVKLDLFPLVNQSNQALLTVIVKSSSTLKTNIFSVKLSGQHSLLRKIENKNNHVLRPIGNYLLGQTFDPSAVWQKTIYRYRTTKSGYQQDVPVHLPVSQPRLLSLSSLGEDRWAMITQSGDLTLLTNRSVLDTVDGNFGATQHNLSSNRAMSKRPETTEPIRLPPNYIQSQDLLSVTRNPSSSWGLGSLLFGGNTAGNAVIKLFQVRRNQLVRAGSIGPLNGRIVDVDSPQTSPEQLLWVRVEKPDTFHLEMIDFSKE